MDISEIINGIFSFMPLFRAVWAATSLIGAFLLVLAFILKRNPERKKSPWIVGGIGSLMLISSGTQLLFSLI